MPDQPGSHRRGDDATRKQSQDDRPVRDAHVRDQRRGDRHGDHEFGRVHRPDRLPHRAAAGEEGGRGDRPPAATADGVEQPGEEAQDALVTDAMVRNDLARGAHQHDHAEDQQVGIHEGFQGLAGNAGQEPCADDPANDPGNGQATEGFPVDIAKQRVGAARYTRGEHLGRVHGGAGNSRRQAERQQHGVGNHAVRHAKGTIDQLGKQADADEGEELGPVHARSTWWSGSHHIRGRCVPHMKE